MTGRIPGVDVTAGSFEPCAANTIRIRGTRSITAGNNRLYDRGVPITRDLRDIDRNAIERIEVLKDASAAAVYGSRGANGVVLITTKRGVTSGNTEFTLNTTYGVSEVRRQVDMMNAQEFPNFRRESYRSAGNAACQNYLTNPAACDAVALDATMCSNLAAGVNTNWQHLMLARASCRTRSLASPAAPQRVDHIGRRRDMVTCRRHANGPETRARRRRPRARARC